MRKLASIQSIQEIKFIPNADSIAAYRINNWWVVDQIHKYSVGEIVVFFEIDSWIPTELAPFLSRGKEPKEYQGIKGERLRTIKLKGQISQGLILSTYITPLNSVFVFEGDDVTEKLGIIKWEPTFSESSGSNIPKGNFPHFIPKTDQERIQNLSFDFIRSRVYEISEKVEGSSMTVYQFNGTKGVCSRNIDLKEGVENNPKWDTSHFWRAAKEAHVHEAIGNLNIAIQGELVGPGIQGNYYNLNELRYYVYNIWDIDAQEYWSTDRAYQFCMARGLKYVPVITQNWIDPITETISSILKKAEGFSLINSEVPREGLVYKDTKRNFSFKAISDTYLLNK